MENAKESIMELNRETAMRLWVKTFGKETRVNDYAGRTIVKSAYGDRNSDYGWNVDHILPQSKGGATADHNLICCHILTNDEKADRFPAFVANGIRFEIIKVENHYEIRKTDKSQQPNQQEAESTINFYDSAAGVRLFKDLKGVQNKTRWVGSVLIVLRDVQSTAVLDFMEGLFDGENISFDSSAFPTDVRVLVRDFDLPLQSDISGLLDKCVLAKTYLSHYFVPMNYLNSYVVFFRVDPYDQEHRADLYADGPNPIFLHPRSNREFRLSSNRQLGYYDRLDNALFINDLVWCNTRAKKEVEKGMNGFTEYNYVFSRLADNLRKEVGGE